VVNVLGAWSNSGAQYLLQTTYETQGSYTADSNFQLVDGTTNTLIDMRKEPYALVPAMDTFVEQSHDANWKEMFNVWSLPLERRKFPAPPSQGQCKTTNTDGWYKHNLASM
jgi:hypothetical protein